MFDSDLPRNVSEFEKLHRLGEGTYGVVYKARDRASNKVSRYYDTSYMRYVLFNYVLLLL